MSGVYCLSCSQGDEGDEWDQDARTPSIRKAVLCSGCGGELCRPCVVAGYTRCLDCARWVSNWRDAA